MELKNCLEFGKDLGLKTVEEAIVSVDCHAMNMFVYDQIANELNELLNEYNELYKADLIGAKTPIEEALTVIGSR